MTSHGGVINSPAATVSAICLKNAHFIVRTDQDVMMLLGPSSSPTTVWRPYHGLQRALVAVRLCIGNQLDRHGRAADDITWLIAIDTGIWTSIQLLLQLHRSGMPLFLECKDSNRDTCARLRAILLIVDSTDNSTRRTDLLLDSRLRNAYKER